MKFFHTTQRRAAAAFLLFALNAWICRRLFVTEYTSHLESIEAAYISISQYILNHPRSIDWFAQWYNGVPFQNTYPPLLHFSVAAVAWIFHISPALSHHVVCAFLYALGPVTLFLMAGRLSGNWGASFFAALAYSIVSPSPWLHPDIYSWTGPRSNVARLQSLIYFGDGPHVSSLTLLPLAILALDWALQKWTSTRVFLAALALAAVVLTNWLGAFSLALAIVCYLLARAGDGKWNLIPRAALITVLAYCLVAPWITKSTIIAVRDNAQYVIGRFPLSSAQAWCGLAIVAVVAILFFIFRRTRVAFFERFNAYFLFFLSCLVLADAWFHFYLMPQPYRYHLEFEMVLCTAAAFIAAPLFARFSHRYQIAILLIVAVLATRNFMHAYRMGSRMIIPIDMSKSIEYHESRWLQDHLPDSRVFLAGSIQFWVDAFATTSEVGGGYGQGVINPTVPIVHFGVPYTTGDGERTAMWLRLYGASAVVVSEENGRDAYRQIWHDPRKFQGVLPELWREGGDAIYKVPQRSDSLAHVILPSQIAQRAPVNVVDVPPVAALAGALEDPSLPVANFHWLDSAHARIETNMTPDQVLFVQISHHPGWTASVQGQSRKVSAEPLGMMIVEPQCNGACTVDLVYTGGPEMRLAKLLRYAALTILLGWFALERVPRRAQPAV